jgi:hypothetical protein
VHDGRLNQTRAFELSPIDYRVSYALDLITVCVDIVGVTRAVLGMMREVLGERKRPIEGWWRESRAVYCLRGRETTGKGHHGKREVVMRIVQCLICWTYNRVEHVTNTYSCRFDETWKRVLCPWNLAWLIVCLL